MSATPPDSPTPAEAELLAAQLDLAHGDVVGVANGLLTKVHPPERCAGESCWMHNPSEHHMSTWPTRWHGTGEPSERVCPHDLGHPDPDDVALFYRRRQFIRGHQCDGCCIAAGPEG